MKLYLTFIFGLLFNLSIFSQSEKLEIHHLTDNYYIFTTYNSFKGIQFPSNGMYLVTDEGVALFDTPWDTTQFQPLLDSIRNRHNKEIVICIATHSHEDRTAGIDYYKSLGIKTYTTQKTDSISKIRNEKRAEFLIDTDTIFKLGAYSFQTFYPGEAHTPDNIVIWFEKEKILYGGCMIKSCEAKDLGNLADANVMEWSYSLKNIESKFGKPFFTIPGHQSWKNKKSLKHTSKLVRKYLKNIKK